MDLYLGLLVLYVRVLARRSVTKHVRGSSHEGCHLLALFIPCTQKLKRNWRAAQTHLPKLRATTTCTCKQSGQGGQENLAQKEGKGGGAHTKRESMRGLQGKCKEGELTRIAQNRCMH